MPEPGTGWRSFAIGVCIVVCLIILAVGGGFAYLVYQLQMTTVSLNQAREEKITTIINQVNQKIDVMQVNYEQKINSLTALQDLLVKRKVITTTDVSNMAKQLGFETTATTSPSPSPSMIPAPSATPVVSPKPSPTVPLGWDKK